MRIKLFIILAIVLAACMGCSSGNTEYNYKYAPLKNSSWTSVLNLPEKVCPYPEESTVFIGNSIYLIADNRNSSPSLTDIYKIAENSPGTMTRIYQGDLSDFVQLLITKDGNDIYIGGLDISTGRRNVKMFKLVSSGNETTLEDLDFPDELKFEAIRMQIIAGNGCLYVMASKKADHAVYSFKYDIAKKEWDTLGSLESILYDAVNFYIALDTDGTLYAAVYSNKSIKIAQYNKSESAWKEIEGCPALPDWFVFGFNVYRGNIYVAVDDPGGATVSAFKYTPAKGWGNFYIPRIDSSSTYVEEIIIRNGKLYLPIGASSITNRISIFYYDIINGSGWYVLEKCGFAPDLNYGSSSSGHIYSVSDVTGTPYFFYTTNANPNVYTLLKYNVY